MKKSSSTGLNVLGVAAAGIGFLVFSSPSTAHAAVIPSNTPQRPLQNRPISVSATGPAKAAVIRIFQQQLKDMGYRITAIDGITGQETQSAARVFVADHQAQVDATRRAYASLPNDIGLLYLVDDVYRSSFDLPPSIVIHSAP